MVSLVLNSAEKAGEGPQGLDPTSEGKKVKRTEARDRRASEPPQRARRPWGSVSLAQSNPRVNQIFPALRLARGSLGLPGAHLLVAWGLLPQSTRAPPCGATAPVWKKDLRPREHILTNGSGPTHLLAAMGIGQRSSHPLFRGTFKSLVYLSANPLLGKRDPHSLIGMSQSQSRATPSS